MIFYFSATGNSKYVAECLAEDHEPLIFIPTAMDRNEYTFQVKDERVGFISPTYDWTLPSVTSEFLQKLNLSFDKKPYMYYVATYGTTSGAAASMADHILKKQGLSLDASFDIKMPDTWTPIFDLSNAEEVQKTLNGSNEEIQEFKNQIKNKVTGKHMSLTTPHFTGMIGRSIYNTFTRNTSNLSVTNACIGCGLCAKKCPVHAIEIKDKKPVWIKDTCTMCLGCLHRCPKFAIQCGKNTSHHGQYVNPYTTI